MTLNVAIQGYPASFHDIAARQFLGQDIELICCDTFADVFGALQNGTADVALSALENSLYGSINEVYDLLLKHNFWISGEVYLRIHQHLIGLPGASINELSEIHSHPVALAQCEDYLDRHVAQAERFEHHDTAASVADIKKWNDPTKAAIASHTAATLHGMQILAHEIETNKQNYTRFVVLKRAPLTSIATKTSMVLTTDHKPGALHQALGAFASRGINLYKLQSRPIIGEAWHYMFYVDVGAGMQEQSLQQALTELKAQNCEVTILGSYENTMQKVA